MVSQEDLDKLSKDAEKKMDVNKDGKISFFEMINFFVSNPTYVFLAIAVLSMNPIKDFLLDGFNTGIWSITSLLNTLGASITAFIFYWVMRALDSNTRSVITTMQEQYEAKTEAVMKENKTLREDLEVQKNLVQTLNLSLKLKEQEIELMQKKLV